MVSEAGAWISEEWRWTSGSSAPQRNPWYVATASRPRVGSEVTALAMTRNWDPADRIIVATARVLRATLATNDARIRESKLVDVV